MLIFLAAMTVAREVEAGTLRRLRLTRMTSLDYLGGVSLAMVVLGVLAVVLTFATAWALGFHSRGPVWVAVLVGAITTLGVVGTGLMVACVSRTSRRPTSSAASRWASSCSSLGPSSRSRTWSCSSCRADRRPLRRVAPTHAVVALNKVLNLGSGLSDLGYELTALVVLSAVYMAAGSGSSPGRSSAAARTGSAARRAQVLTCGQRFGTTGPPRQGFRHPPGQASGVRLAWRARMRHVYPSAHTVEEGTADGARGAVRGDGAERHRG